MTNLCKILHAIDDRWTVVMHSQTGMHRLIEDFENIRLPFRQRDQIKKGLRCCLTHHLTIASRNLLLIERSAIDEISQPLPRFYYEIGSPQRRNFKRTRKKGVILDRISKEERESRHPREAAILENAHHPLPSQYSNPHHQFWPCLPLHQPGI